MKRMRWVRRVLVAVSVISTTVWLVAQREIQRSAGNRELAAAIELASENDPDWTWDRLNAARAKPPDGRNGADIIPRVWDLMPREWVRDVNPERWEPDIDAIPANRRLHDDSLAEVRQNLARAATAVELARSLKDYPSGRRDIALNPDVLSTPLRDTSHTRAVGRLLLWDAVLAAEDAETTRLADDLQALLNVARSLGDEPMLISQVIRVAIRRVMIQTAEHALGQRELDPARLASLQTALAADAEEPLLLYGLRGDRAAYDTFLKNLADGTVDPGTINGVRDRGISFGSYGWWLARGRVPAARACYLNWTTLAVKAARLPPHEQLAAMQCLPTLTDEGDPVMKLALLVLPGAENVTRATLYGMTEARCAVVGIACERFRRQHARWPESLDLLVPALLSAVPLDPYDGQPLRYAKSDVGVVVYSVGKRPTNPFGKSVPIPTDLPEGVEIGFRLYNPDERRLPPLPDVPEREPPP